MDQQGPSSLSRSHGTNIFVNDIGCIEHEGNISNITQWRQLILTKWNYARAKEHSEFYGSGRCALAHR